MKVLPDIVQFCTLPEKFAHFYNVISEPSSCPKYFISAQQKYTRSVLHMPNTVLVYRYIEINMVFALEKLIV